MPANILKEKIEEEANNRFVRARITVLAQATFGQLGQDQARRPLLRGHHGELP